jgi:hypothetical protein
MIVQPPGPCAARMRFVGPVVVEECWVVFGAAGLDGTNSKNADFNVEGDRA